MRKFVGQVNGKTYDTIEEFSKAAQNALTSGDDTISITSYMSDCNCDCDCEKKTDCCDCKKLDDKVVVKTSDLIPVVKNGTFWNVSENLKDLLPHITKENRAELMEFVDKKKSEFEVTERECRTNIDDCEKKLKEYKTRLASATKGSSYYTDMENLLKETVYDFQKDSITKDAKKKDEPKSGPVNSVSKDEELDIDELFNNIGNSFSKWLKDIGFWDRLI